MCHRFLQEIVTATKRSMSHCFLQEIVTLHESRPSCQCMVLNYTVSYISLGSSAGSVHSNTKREACVGNDFIGPISPIAKDGSGYNFTLSDETLFSLCTILYFTVPLVYSYCSNIVQMLSLVPSTQKLEGHRPDDFLWQQC